MLFLVVCIVDGFGVFLVVLWVLTIVGVDFVELLCCFGIFGYDF